jgi:hypothetical protein
MMSIISSDKPPKSPSEEEDIMRLPIWVLIPLSESRNNQSLDDDKPNIVKKNYPGRSE